MSTERDACSVAIIILEVVLNLHTAAGIQGQYGAIGLVESVRVRAEYAGRCHLNKLQAAELWWSKAVFMFVVPVGLLVPMRGELGSQHPFTKPVQLVGA